MPAWYPRNLWNRIQDWCWYDTLASSVSRYPGDKILQATPTIRKIKGLCRWEPVPVLQVASQDHEVVKDVPAHKAYADRGHLDNLVLDSRDPTLSDP